MCLKSAPISLSSLFSLCLCLPPSVFEEKGSLTRVTSLWKILRSPWVVLGMMELCHFTTPRHILFRSNTRHDVEVF